MAIVILILTLLAGVYALSRLNARDREAFYAELGDPNGFWVDYSQCVTKAQKSEAIADAQTDVELDAMWAVWEKSGWSKEGLLYAELVRRREQLGYSVETEDLDRLQAAEAKWRHGQSLPPITGRGQ